MKLVIVTGMSGAGKTIALKMLEDIGFYCVDNLPISLVDKFVQLVSEGTSIEKAALGLDIRSGEELGNLDEILENWRRSNVDVQVLFLDANDAVLIKRYKETRRTHPLAGAGRLENGIEKEREKLAYEQAKKDQPFMVYCPLKTEQKFEDFILHFKGGDRQLECELRGEPLKEYTVVNQCRYLPDAFEHRRIPLYICSTDVGSDVPADQQCEISHV